jgi:hypothetical protein
MKFLVSCKHTAWWHLEVDSEVPVPGGFGAGPPFVITVCKWKVCKQ